MVSRYYATVPKEIGENAKYRAKIRERAAADWKFRQNMRDVCKDDLLYFVNVFCYLFEPRTNEVMPWVTYPFQDELLLEIDDCIGKRDLVIEKSRDMGATWCCVAVPQWRLQFRELQTFLMMSRVEALVDAPGNPKSMFWKMDFLRKHQPEWLLPPIKRTYMHEENLKTGTAIDGESTNKQATTGDRRTAVIFDEFSKMPNGGSILAASRDVTRCRIFNFTPVLGAVWAYDVAHNPNFRKKTLHWTLHPDKAKGLYYVGEKARSPWYDEECKRARNPQEIAENLDIDWLGSGHQFFDAGTLKTCLDRDAREPYAVGELAFDKDTLRPEGFVKINGGNLSLWLPGDRPLASAVYAVGADIATGTGATNSVLSAVDRRTGEKVAEMATPWMAPDDLGRYAVAFCRWLTGKDGLGAYLVWEDNGPGQLFGQTVVSAGYRNFYYRQNVREISGKPSRIPGWWSTTGVDGTKMALIGDYASALKAGKFVNRSRFALEECRMYVYVDGGEVTNAQAKTTDDPSGARQNHADRVTADALAWRGCMAKTVAESSTERMIPVGSIAWRRLKEREERSQSKELVY